MHDEFQPVPDNAIELAIRWAQRDAEYAKQRRPLDSDIADTIRKARMAEAARLPDVTERARMYARAETWEPPKHQEYGSVKEWLK